MHQVLGHILCPAWCGSSSFPGWFSPPVCTFHMSFLFPGAPWKPTLGYLWLLAIPKCLCIAQENCPPAVKAAHFPACLPSALTEMFLISSYLQERWGNVNHKRLGVVGLVFHFCGKCTVTVGDAHLLCMVSIPWALQLDISFWLPEELCGSKMKCFKWSVWAELCCCC